MNELPKVTIYTDGACSGNPGPGGWGAVLIYGAATKEIFGSELDTTNNKMELLAAIKALQNLKKPCQVELFTDSIYVQKGITEWIQSWLKKGWRKSDNSSVKNADLWQKLYDLTQCHSITWHWVKGHDTNPENIKADILAVKGRKEAELAARIKI